MTTAVDEARALLEHRHAELSTELQDVEDALTALNGHHEAAKPQKQKKGGVSVKSSPAPPSSDSEPRKRLTDDEKAEAVLRADEIGYPSAAEEFGVSASSIYGWKKAGY